MPSQQLTLTALCDAGDVVIGKYARGRGVTIDPVESIEEIGGFSIGNQGATTTGVAGNDQVKFMIVGAVCITPVER